MAALPYNATLSDYIDEARRLFRAIGERDEGALWRVKWEHLAFRGKSIDDVRVASLSLGDAEQVVARGYGFADWLALVAFTDLVNQPAVALFERAVEAVISGDLVELRRLLESHPALARARSARRHRATLLHYVAANGVEGHRQRTPSNAVEVAKILLEAGADVDALADLYDEQCTTMSTLVSSSPPHDAGLQVALADTLLDYGATLEARGSNWSPPLLTALQFGYADAARALVRRGAAVSTLDVAAGLGYADDVQRMLPESSGEQRHRALALAAQHGRTDILRLLLDAGENPDRYNPDGFHSHSTPMHQAALANQFDVVRLLVERGARLDLRDTIYSATPRGWAEYAGRSEIAEYLRNAEAQRDAAASFDQPDV